MVSIEAEVAPGTQTLCSRRHLGMDPGAAEGLDLESPLFFLLDMVAPLGLAQEIGPPPLVEGERWGLQLAPA